MSRWTQAACALLLLVASGCRATRGSYLENRLSDLTDAAHIHGQALSFGALVNAGPLLLGHHHLSGWNSPGEISSLGLGGWNREDVSGTSWGIVIPFSWIEYREPPSDRQWLSQQQDLRERRYSNVSPAWGSVGLDLGFFVGFGARVDIVETLDFVLGIVGIDIAGDDAEYLPPYPEDGDSAAQDSE